MPVSKSHIRLNVNAAIVKNGKILVIEFQDENGIHYNLPGGGVDVGESLETALRRECLEEACVDVSVGRLLMVWEYVPELQKFIFGTRQKVGQIFECKLNSKSIAKMPKKPDKNQTGVKWIPLAELHPTAKSNKPILYPSVGKELLAAIKSPSSPIRVISGV